jgi:hypothetical protein
LVLQGEGKSFSQFGQDDTVCRRFASLEAKGTPPDQAVLASGLANAQASGLAAVPSGQATESRQQLYDIAYVQCMYDKGHLVPLPGLVRDDRLEVSPAPLPRLPAEPPAELSR